MTLQWTASRPWDLCLKAARPEISSKNGGRAGLTASAVPARARHASVARWERWAARSFWCYGSGSPQWEARSPPRWHSHKVHFGCRVDGRCGAGIWTPALSTHKNGHMRPRASRPNALQSVTVLEALAALAAQHGDA